MRQRRWLELIKDYDLEIVYHAGKANVVADAPGRKIYLEECIERLTSVDELQTELRRMSLEVWIQHERGQLQSLDVHADLLDEILREQLTCQWVAKLRDITTRDNLGDFRV